MFLLRRDFALKSEADNRDVAEGEVGYLNGTTGLPVGLHYTFLLTHSCSPDLSKELVRFETF